MSSVTLKIHSLWSIFSVIAFAFCLAPITSGEEPATLSQKSDEAFLQSVQSVDSPAKKPPIGAFFASIIETREEIEFLAGHKRYEDLLKVVERFRKTLDQTSTVLPENERQRAARFTAASRTLGQLSKALHNFMWNGKDEQLFDATEKLKQLLAHVQSLINPEELAQAQAFRQSAKG